MSLDNFSRPLMALVSAVCVLLSLGNAFEGDVLVAVITACAAALTLVAALIPKEKREPKE